MTRYTYFFANNFLKHVFLKLTFYLYYIQLITSACELKSKNSSSLGRSFSSWVMFVFRRARFPPFKTHASARKGEPNLILPYPVRLDYSGDAYTSLYMSRAARRVAVFIQWFSTSRSRTFTIPLVFPPACTYATSGSLSLR